MTAELPAADRERLIRWLEALVAIPSVNPFDAPPAPGTREREVAEYLGTQMEALGLEVAFQEAAPGRPNVFGTLRGAGSGPRVMLAGHLDTVGVEGCSDPFRPRIENGRLFGRGSCDMKAALAAYLEVVALLREDGAELAGDLIVAGIADEEYRMVGSIAAGRSGPAADFGIIGEPTDLAVCPSHKGQFSLFIRTFGRAVHSSVPELGDNAITHMGRVIREFEDFNEALAKKAPHPLCGHGRFSPGVIRGGTIVAAVPDYCELEVDRRRLPGESREEVIGEYRARLDRLVREVPGFRYELSEPSWDVDTLDVPRDSPVVQSLAAAVRDVTGRPAALQAFPAATDAPNLGFPCVICGPGSLAQAHTVDEYVEIQQVTDAASIYLGAVFALCGRQN